MDSWSDGRAGLMAVFVVGGAALTILLLILAVIAYSGNWGYGIHF